MSSKTNSEISSNIIILRALKMGISLLELDNITIGFILDLIDESNGDVSKSEIVEADAEIIDKFF